MQKLMNIFEKSIMDNYIDNAEYKKWGVKKGLRNEDGTGVLVGLTRISDVYGYKLEDGVKKDDLGELYYRGIPLTQIIEGIDKSEEVNGFEETAFLILFGHLPTSEELQLFSSTLREAYSLPGEFVSMNLLSNPSMHVMNKIQRSLLMLYETDQSPDDDSSENLIRQGMGIIAKLPAIICYGYQGKKHLMDKGSLVIHHVDKTKSLSGLLLSLLRDDGVYSRKEEEMLDAMLVVHMDHGAGNNSTFTSIVVSSTGTDLYSALSAAVGSLKGPKHGGANIYVKKMFDEIKAEIGVEAGDEAIREIIRRLLNKDFFDNSGLIYGLGHAVYTLSDPRAELVKAKARELAAEKGELAVFEFMERFENLAKEYIYQVKGKRVCANVDFYSGFIYELLGISEDLFTPMFVMARTVGWIAHIIENRLYCSRIIRPAGKYVGEVKDFVSLEDR